MNKFLSQIEKMAQDKATLGEIARGYISPAWMENNIAKKHDKEGLKGAGANVKKHLIGGLRQAGRMYAEGAGGGVLGAAVGAGVGALKKDPKLGAMVGGLAGAYSGMMHGGFKSLKNQANEAHQKYSGTEKKAAFDALIANGMDFDSALAAIEKEAGLAGVAGRTAASVAGKAKDFASAVKSDAMKAPGLAKTMATGKMTGTRFTTPMSNGRMGAAKALAGNKAVQTGAGVIAGAAATGGAMGAAMNRQKEKQACMSKLLADGVDFDQAVELVKQAEKEIYGE